MTCAVKISSLEQSVVRINKGIYKKKRLIHVMYPLIMKDYTTYLMFARLMGLLSRFFTNNNRPFNLFDKISGNLDFISRFLFRKFVRKMSERNEQRKKPPFDANSAVTRKTRNDSTKILWAQNGKWNSLTSESEIFVFPDKNWHPIASREVTNARRQTTWPSELGNWCEPRKSTIYLNKVEKTSPHCIIVFNKNC